MTATASPFQRKATVQSTDDFELPPAGLHPARVVALVGLGTHENEYKGEKKPDKEMVFLAWELVGTKTNAGKPFVVGEGYTDSLGKSSDGKASNYRKLLEGWRGQPFEKDEEFDPFVLLGMECVVNVSIGLSKKDKKFSQVNSVSPPFEGQNVPEATRELFCWHISQWGDHSVEPPIPDWMPRYMGDKLIDVIKASKEWMKLESQGKLIPAANMPSNGRVQDRHPAPADTSHEMAKQGEAPKQTRKRVAF